MELGEDTFAHRESALCHCERSEAISLVQKRMRLLRRGHIRFAQCMVYPEPFNCAQDRPVEGLLAMTKASVASQIWT